MVSLWLIFPHYLKTFTGISGLMFCCCCVEFLLSGCSQSPHLLFQCSDDTGIGTPYFSSPKPPRSTKVMLKNWLQYTDLFFQLKIFMVFTKRKMTFDTEVHNEFKRTKKKKDYSWKNQLFLELWRLLLNLPVIKQQRVLLDTQSNSSDGVNCQNIHWFQRNYDNL